MLTTIIVLAALAIPFVRELYFNLPEASVAAAYIPAGRSGAPIRSYLIAIIALLSVPYLLDIALSTSRSPGCEQR